MKKLLLALLLTLGVIPQARAQQYVPTLRDYDLDSATYTYCAPPTESWRNAPLRVTGTAASTTVASMVASSAALDFVDVGSILRFTASGQTYYRWVTAKASADSITVNSALTLNTTVGSTFQYRVPACGTDATSGWMYVAPQQKFKIVINIDQEDTTTGIDLKVECQDYDPGMTPTVIFPTAIYTTTLTLAILSEEPWYRCRVGMRMTSTDDGGDLTTSMEKISIDYMGAQ